MMKNRFTKWISAIILTCMVVSIIGLSASVSVKSKKLKTAKAEIEILKIQQDSLIGLTKTLAEMDAVRCSVTIQVKNTAVLGSVNAGDLNANIEQIASYTRKEVLDSILLKKAN